MGKELLLSALKGEQTERAPWVPFVGCHGGFLIDKDAETYLKSADLIVQGVEKAIELYQPDGIPVNFDLSMEAEILGCELQWAKENPPAVVNHVLESKTLDDLRGKNMKSLRILETLKAVEKLQKKKHDVAFYGLLTGPFTLALHLKGTDIFMEMFDSKEKVHELLQFCTEIGMQVADLFIDAGCDVISMVDPMTSQISPEAFREFVSPYAGAFFKHVRDRQALSSFFVCGHAQKNVEAMCETGPDNISVDENIPLDFVKTTCRKYGVSFGGNLQLTVVLLMGSENDVRRNTIECLDIGGTTGFILAPGCDLPYSVPVKNMQLVTQIVHDTYQQEVSRELLKSKEDVQLKINLSDYGNADKVIIDVITLDSESCAPCQYMVEAVRAVAPHFADLLIWREHRIKERESVEFMMGLMVKNIPTICIDGQIRFVSTIPSRDELIRAIQERINEKFSLKLQERRGQLVLLADDKEESQVIWDRMQQAVRELGSMVELVRITDREKIQSYNVAGTPAVVAVDEKVKSVGRVPSVEVIKEWLKSLA
ncbi:thioredoxin family protein [candidate division KSB1 bacterium]|nr:thioredoxin family protein [candidate division KSB1 bacterium]